MSPLPRPLLRAIVHLEALASQPAAYLQGVGWRVRGLKLRSRHRFSALMGHTRHAYDLWMTGRERDRLRAIPAVAVPEPLLIVVDCRASSTNLAETLDSITGTRIDDVDVILLGPAEATGYRTAPDARALATMIGAGAVRWVIAVECGDRLAPQAILAYRAVLADQPQARVFYADEDLWHAGRRHSPHFKPQWNPELALHHDFLSNASMFRCDPASIDGDWPRSAMNLSGPVPPVHVPHVLHHRRQRLQPVRPPAQPPRLDLPHVSVIIPTRDHVALLRTCMDGVRAADYPSFDVTVIDNGSTDPETLAYLDLLERDGIQIDRQPGPFNFAAMHNAVVPGLAGPLVCFLNNDIEMTALDWLAHLAAPALRSDVGAVGARLLYPDRTIQHAGVVTGVGGGAAHAHRQQADDDPGYFDRAHLPQFVSAVTAACLVVAKERFQAVGGFNADDFAVAFNDVDLCLKLNQRGWQSFYEPRACLIHHESKSRGFDRDGPGKVRFAGELAALKRIWKPDLLHDPFHHPELSPLSEQFVVRL